MDEDSPKYGTNRSPHKSGLTYLTLHFTAHYYSLLVLAILPIFTFPTSQMYKEVVCQLRPCFMVAERLRDDEKM